MPQTGTNELPPAKKPAAIIMHCLLILLMLSTCAKSKGAYEYYTSGSRAGSESPLGDIKVAFVVDLRAQLKKRKCPLFVL